MEPEITLYLLWSPQGWGVFSKSSCPDPTGFPSHYFREYGISRDERSLVFDKLLQQRDYLVQNKILPTEQHYDRDFPELSTLL